MKVDLKTVQDINNPIIKKCPYCGCETFYVNCRISGTIQYYSTYDGESDYRNSSIYDGMLEKPIGKFAYCGDCNKKVFRFKN